MTRAQLISKLLKVDPKLATSALKNDKLAAKLQVQQLLKDLNIKTQ